MRAAENTEDFESRISQSVKEGLHFFLRSIEIFFG
jgi:hypothetical protein